MGGVEMRLQGLGQSGAVLECTLQRNELGLKRLYRLELFRMSPGWGGALKCVQAPGIHLQLLISRHRSPPDAEFCRNHIR